MGAETEQLFRSQLKEIQFQAQKLTEKVCRKIAGQRYR